ncbi:MAG: Spy/CpxP family protein refolding chaperone [Planctomycetaceae bacterium]|jgi:Spy/CpxP family protein refolding chaperone|nr:Spy/CpxP family protein refolding chaperone [Planctomycetaceae bacterium]
MKKTILCLFGALAATGLLIISAADILAQPADGGGRGRDRGRSDRDRNTGDRGGDRDRDRGGDRGRAGGFERGGRTSGGFGFGFGSGLGVLLQNENAKKHLNLTEDQVAKLQKISDDQRANFPRPPRGNNEDGRRPAPPSEEDMKKFNETIEKSQAESKKKINEVLTPEQQAKFKVLPFQVAGGLESRFINARTFEFLDLSDAQKEQFKKLDEENRAEFGKLFTQPTGNDTTRLTQEEVRKQREELSKKAREKALALLTPAQKATAEKLTEEAKQLKLQPQRDERDRGNRDRRERGERNRGNNEYRPGSDSWRPGAGTPENGGNSRRPFPRNSDAPPPPPPPPAPPVPPAT